MSKHAVAWLMLMDAEGLIHRRVAGEGHLLSPAGCQPQGTLTTVDLDPAECPRSTLCRFCWPPHEALTHDELWGGVPA